MSRATSGSCFRITADIGGLQADEVTDAAWHTVEILRMSGGGGGYPMCFSDHQGSRRLAARHQDVTVLGTHAHSPFASSPFLLGLPYAKAAFGEVNGWV